MREPLNSLIHLANSWLKNLSLPIGIFGLLTVAACGTSYITSTDTHQSVQAAWIELGEQGRAYARVITLATACPSLIQDNVPAPMHVRAQPATVPQRSTISVVSKPSAFPVLTCEALLKSGVKSVRVAGRNLPVPKSDPLKILVLGDTGCRLKASKNAAQACNDAEGWAFPTVAKTAATFAPDLVVHVGDYHYRETPCPEGVAGCANSPWGYGWDTWRADFFDPAAPLLAAAPWVMTRGNHEICARAGQGWWRFLDPRPLVVGRDCNDVNNDSVNDYSDPYAVPLGGGAQLVVMDSAKIPTKTLSKDDKAYPIYFNQLRKASQLAEQADFSIVLVHHPVLGFGDGQDSINPGNAGLQSVLQDIYPQRLFVKNVKMILSGDIHLFEAITFQTDHPAQFVVGNGGSSPDGALPDVLSPDMTPFVQAKIKDFFTTNRSGFMTMEREAGGKLQWTIKAWDKNGGLLYTHRLGRLG